VLELTPRDAGHIPKPQVGWRVTVTGVWLTDGTLFSHGWNELNPIFRLVHAGQTFRSGPQFGGDPDSARAATPRRSARRSARPRPALSARATDGTLEGEEPGTPPRGRLD